MKLEKWLTDRGMSDSAFGRIIGKSHTTVMRLRRGEIVPKLATIVEIRNATAGAVTADDFMAPMEPGRGDATQCESSSLEP